MKGKQIGSLDDLMLQLKGKNRAYLLLYKKNAEQSECALKNLKAADVDENAIAVFLADVSVVRDIHEKYGITSVPTMLEFSKGDLVNVLKGCHQSNFYKSFFENAIYTAKVDENKKAQKRVTVYTTPTCSWCTTVKSHLKKHGIRYTELDVSRDQNAAAEMQRKSGQMGVPQTDIGGEIVVGFDKVKLNRLLGIQ
jgi:glutaredoxin-like YruB-family protein